MHNRRNYLYVGVDLHKEHHTAVMINCWQEKLGEIQFDNKTICIFEVFIRSRDICE